MELQIDQLAIHYLDPPNKLLLYSDAPEDVPGLPVDIRKFFLGIVNEVVDSDDAGPTYSAKFLPPVDPPDPTSVNGLVQALLSAPAAFFDKSKAIAQCLYAASPPVAPPGVLAVIALHDQGDDQKKYACLVKVRYEDRNFVALTDASLTELTVEEIKHMLLDQIQKGAIIPHPDRADYHLKLIDKQVTGEPAVYFKDTFLGCRTKISDENQVRGIIPALEMFARVHEIAVRTEKLPALITALQTAKPEVETTAQGEVAAVVKTAEVAAAAVDVQLFSAPVVKDELEEFIKNDLNIGPIDIPQRSFNRKGKRGKARKMSYVLRDPQYKGVVISGPAGVLSRILSVQGDAATFTVKTNINGYTIDYD
jgi:hypothetical protein